MAHRPVEAPPSPDVPVHHHQLAQAMRDLPGDQARALLLHDGLGMTVPETAAELAVPEGTVRSWLSRSRKVVAARIHPIKTQQASPIPEVLERTRAMLAGSPPPWLRKVLASAGVGPAKPDFEED